MIKAIKKLPVFLKEVRDELKKVNRSTRKELVTASCIVVVVCIALTLYIYAVDFGLSHLVQLILN